MKDSQEIRDQAEFLGIPITSEQKLRHENAGLAKRVKELEEQLQDALEKTSSAERVFESIGAMHWDETYKILLVEQFGGPKKYLRIWMDHSDRYFMVDWTWDTGTQTKKLWR